MSESMAELLVRVPDPLLRRQIEVAVEREQARADRYEAEFAACKALLIAEQKRAERAEAERAAAERDLRDFKRDCDRMLDDAYQGGKRAEQRASEARALAFRDAATIADNCQGSPNWDIAERLRGAAIALAALPVEPARLQVTDNANALGAPAAGCAEDAAPTALGHCDRWMHDMAPHERRDDCRNWTALAGERVEEER
jgi:hypothetical protein